MGDKNTTDVGRVGVWKAGAAVLSVLVGVLSSIVGWACVWIINHEVRIARVEESIKYEVMMLERITEKLESLPDKYPPAWLKQQVQDNKRGIEELKRRK